MTDSNALREQNEPPEDVASLYSWANLHGAKYRDFSAARAQTRAMAQMRIEQAQKEEKERAAREAARAEQQARKVQQQQRTEIVKPSRMSSLADQVEALKERQPQTVASVEAPQVRWLAETQTARSRSAAAAVPPPPVVPTPVAPTPVAPTPVAPTPAAPRWYMLHDVLAAPPVASNVLATRAPSPAQAPVLAIFSLAGGVGKTSLTATLGRVLSAAGERVLLVDTASYGLLPFYFGAQDQRPGQLRTFSPQQTVADAPVQMVSMDAEAMGDGDGSEEPVSAAIQAYGRGLDRVIVDLATASGATTRRVLRLSPTVLVPLTPEMNSVASVQAIEQFFLHQEALGGAAIRPYYVLNQFDATRPLHMDVQRSLAQQLGERLLGFTLRWSPELSEALAEGMTVVDYAPQSAVTGDYDHLAEWVKKQSAPAARFGGVRWSER